MLQAVVVAKLAPSWQATEHSIWATLPRFQLQQLLHIRAPEDALIYTILLTPNEDIQTAASLFTDSSKECLIRCLMCNNVSRGNRACTATGEAWSLSLKSCAMHRFLKLNSLSALVADGGCSPSAASSSAAAGGDIVASAASLVGRLLVANGVVFDKTLPGCSAAAAVDDSVRDDGVSAMCVTVCRLPKSARAPALLVLVSELDGSCTRFASANSNTCGRMLTISAVSQVAFKSDDSQHDGGYRQQHGGLGAVSSPQAPTRRSCAAAVARYCRRRSHR